VVKSSIETMLGAIDSEDFLVAVELCPEKKETLALFFSKQTETWYFKNAGKDTLCFSLADGFEFFVIENGNPVKKSYVPESFVRRAEKCLVAFISTEKKAVGTHKLEKQE